MGNTIYIYIYIEWHRILRYIYIYIYMEWHNSSIWSLEDILAQYFFILYEDYVLQTSTDLMKENSLTVKKAISRRYLAKSLTDADYSDDRKNPYNIAKSK